jgi:hypothetical protein
MKTVVQGYSHIQEEENEKGSCSIDTGRPVKFGLGSLPTGSNARARETR